MFKDIERIFEKSIGNRSNHFVYDYDDDKWIFESPFELFATALENEGYTLDEYHEDSDEVSYRINGFDFTSDRQVVDVFDLDDNSFHGGWRYEFTTIIEG
jgi:hypothetical protein